MSNAGQGSLKAEPALAPGEMVKHTPRISRKMQLSLRPFPP